MNEVLELQKLAHEADGKGDTVEAMITTTIGPITTVITTNSTISIHNC
ncbi:class III lanthipeptide [Paenibacillus sp. FSL R7-0652]|uniref:Class III lanthipeptide n=1 Tax=Paenibacillus sp. AN1007 TaxID=3151385 RepID=A0AAU8NG05_9BACL